MSGIKYKWYPYRGEIVRWKYGLETGIGKFVGQVNSTQWLILRVGSEAMPQCGWPGSWGNTNDKKLGLSFNSYYIYADAIAQNTISPPENWLMLKGRNVGISTTCLRTIPDQIAMKRSEVERNQRIERDIEDSFYRVGGGGCNGNWPFSSHLHVESTPSGGGIMEELYKACVDSASWSVMPIYIKEEWSKIGAGKKMAGARERRKYRHTKGRGSPALTMETVNALYDSITKSYTPKQKLMSKVKNFIVNQGRTDTQQILFRNGLIDQNGNYTDEYYDIIDELMAHKLEPDIVKYCTDMEEKEKVEKAK